jgi:hypothetical protein
MKEGVLYRLKSWAELLLCPTLSFLRLKPHGVLRHRKRAFYMRAPDDATGHWHGVCTVVWVFYAWH